MKDCPNLCGDGGRRCESCQKNYNVSTEFYEGLRTANNQKVVGYLVKDKRGNVEGILNKATHFAELAYIKEDTIKKAV